MSDTPKTDAWKLAVCGQGNSAYLAWPNSVWEGIENMEREYNVFKKQEEREKEKRRQIERDVEYHTNYANMYDGV